MPIAGDAPNSPRRPSRADAATSAVTSAAPGFNLLRIRLVRYLLLSPVFPYALQAILLLAFVALAMLGWGRYAPEGVGDKLYAKTNLVNLLIWGLWWPAMVWMAVAFGRGWCAVCPLELVANGTERLGRRLGIRQRRLSRWLTSGVLILVLYAVIQLLVAGIHLHRVPAYTSAFLWTLLAGAALVGLLFKDRAFCRGFCPVGLLLGTYGRGSMLAVRRSSPEDCEACEGKDCWNASNRTRPDARSCPSLLNPAKLQTNTDCLVCGQCIKVCQPQDNMGLYLRQPFHPADARQPLASWPATLFVVFVSGFVAYELCTEWDAAKAVFLWVPTHVGEALGMTAYEGWIKGVWMLFVFPCTTWLLLGITVLLTRGAATMGEAWQRLALPLVVVIAAGHMAKGLAKVSSWGGYLPRALWDPVGQDYASAISTGTTAKPAGILPMFLVSAASLVLILVMGYYGLRESRIADPSSAGTRAPALWIVIAGSAFLVLGWGFFK